MKEMKQDVSIEEIVKFEKDLEKYCGRTNYQNFIALVPKIKD